MVHRIVPSGWVQMGDTQSGSKGDGGHSSFDQKCVSKLVNDDMYRRIVSSQRYYDSVKIETGF